MMYIISAGLSRNTISKLRNVLHKVVLNSLKVDPLVFDPGVFAIDESLFASRKVMQPSRISM